MKKILLTLLLVNYIFSELIIEITKSSENLIKVAVIQKQQATKIGDLVVGVIEQDLKRTGEFEVLTKDQMLSIPTKESEVIQRDWLLLEVDAIIFLDIDETRNNLDIKFLIYDVGYKDILDDGKVLGLPDSLRQTSHFVSDEIYKYFYGIDGVSATKLMYVTKNNNVHRLIISDSDGFNEQVILKSNQSIISPTWSSDARDIAYVSFENNRAQVFLHNLATGKRESILATGSTVSSPAWSPDKSKIAFSSTMDGNSEIYLMDLRSKRINRLTDNKAIDTEPAWSPDGKKILFTSDRSGSPQIYEINPINLVKRRITTVGNYNARPSYINKQKIIFVHRDTESFQIASLDLRTRELEILTSTKNDESPCIAPNGNVIIYSTKEGELSYLAGVNISSGVKFKLPAIYSELKEPAWSPFLR